MRRSRGGLCARMSLAALLVVAGCGQGPTDDAPVIAIDDGLAPVMTPDQVERIVLDGIRSNEAIVGRALMPPRILRISVTTSDHVGRFDGGAGNGPVERPDGRPFVVWVVRAQGTFTTLRGRLGPRIPMATTGYYVIADPDGSITDFGFP